MKYPRRRRNWADAIAIRFAHLVSLIFATSIIGSASAQTTRYAETPYAAYYVDPMQINLVARDQAFVQVTIRGVYPVLREDGASYFIESRLMECNREYIQAIDIRDFTYDDVPVKKRQIMTIDAAIEDAFSFMNSTSRKATYVSAEPKRLCNIISRWLHQNAQLPNLPTLLPPPSAVAKQSQSTRSVSIARVAGVYEVEGTINSVLPLRFVIDTGATDVSLPQHIGKTLFAIGALTEKDVIGSARYVLADGKLQTATVVSLRSLKIGETELRNIRAAVMQTDDAPLLLGQSALRALGKWRINSEQLRLEID